MLTFNLARPGGCVCKSIHFFLQTDIIELGETKEGYLDNLFDSIKHTLQEVRGCWQCLAALLSLPQPCAKQQSDLACTCSGFCQRWCLLNRLYSVGPLSTDPDRFAHTCNQAHWHWQCW